MNFDKIRKDSKIRVNQSIHCNREGYRESRVKASTGANRITGTRLELGYSHPCSVKKSVHYHEYRELTLHAKCVITDNDEADIRPNKTYLVLANEYGDMVSFDTTYRRNRHGLPFASFVSVNHYRKFTLLGCAFLENEEIPNFDWLFTKWVRCVRTAPWGSSRISARPCLDFVTYDEEIAILRSTLWDAKSKLIDYHASMRSNTIAAAQNSMPTQSAGGVSVHDMQGPSRVATKGRPKSKKLGVDLDKSIKKSMQKKKRNSHPDVVDLRSDNDYDASRKKAFDDATGWNASDGGGFISLLNSFGHS
ncbi:hypothetical protein Ahy_B05g075902 [Arachis hypogaea]|uniref:MULE transposase domain-containing protein n=1 Tax=Arachis hypogaea TaxID=3818 RepID=A0A444Z2A6_ARAHY|nr:hypothetical protein Ahy_B05g075902 [Arachis hypogaea]